MHWIHLAQDMFKWRGLVGMVINLLGVWNGNFFINWETVSFQGEICYMELASHILYVVFLFNLTD
jgi:hypothetical protein